MTDQRCHVLRQEELKAGYFRLELSKPFQSFIPGQFCMVRVPGLSETLLRRPFSLCQESEQSFQLVYKAIGPTTRAMSRLRAGDELQVMAPLGQGLDWSGYEAVIGVAGGYGIAPMLGLGTHLKKAGLSYDVFYGARSESDILLADDFAQAEIPLHVSTEDGSQGFKGYITEKLQQELGRFDRDKTLCFVCGPHGLMKACAQLMAEAGFACHVSMEETMGCGIGICLGCVVPTQEGYRTTCTSGPVMPGETICWEAF